MQYLLPGTKFGIACHERIRRSLSQSWAIQSRGNWLPVRGCSCPPVEAGSPPLAALHLWHQLHTGAAVLKCLLVPAVPMPHWALLWLPVPLHLQIPAAAPPWLRPLPVIAAHHPLAQPRDLQELRSLKHALCTALCHPAGCRLLLCEHAQTPPRSPTHHLWPQLASPCSGQHVPQAGSSAC